MKIIQFINSLSSGGGEKFVVDLSNQLSLLGHEVIICILLDDNIEHFSFNKQYLSETVKFHSFKFSNGFSLKKMLAVEKYIKFENPDIVHCHLNVLPFIFRLAISNRKIKFVHTLHNVAEYASGSKAQRPVNKFFFEKGLIQPVAISKLCQKSYEEYYHLYNAPCIDNGRAKIEQTANFSFVQKDIEALKENRDTKVFIHVARFNEQKNQDLLIDSFNELCKRDINCILLVIGHGFDTEEGYKLQKRACRNIHFLGKKNNVVDYILCSDAFCLSSKYEGLPISLLEALSYGVTPICTPVGGIPDVIEHGKTGYLSKDLETASYVKTIEYFINHPLDKTDLINHYKANYSIETCTDKYVKVFEECIKTTRK